MVYAMVVEKHSKGEYKVIGSDEEGSDSNKLINNPEFREQCNGASYNTIYYESVSPIIKIERSNRLWKSQWG